MAAAVVRHDGEILSSVVQGQEDVHRAYGGVVPELASRDHVRTISRVVERALGEAGVEPGSLGGIAVTAEPGLMGSLLVGLSFAKVHHLVGHLVSAELSDSELVPPYLGLVVSGGHTALYRIEAGVAPCCLGETRDDAVGEAFDKVAVLLGLPYPGGPAISKAAESGDERAEDFPRPMANRGLDFSFSGLKTAVALAVERRGALGEDERADLAASFEAAAVDVLVTKARRALEDEGLGRLAVVGGVAANQRLRARLAQAGRHGRFHVSFPPLALCTDNAAMIAAAGARLLEQGVEHPLSLAAFSRIPIDAAFA